MNQSSRFARTCVLAFVVAASTNATADATRIKVVAPNDIDKLIATTPGRLVIQFSSNDRDCGPCSRANPTYDALAAANPKGSDFVRVLTPRWGDIDKSPIGQRLKIVAVPMIVVFDAGAETRRVLGDRPLQFLEKEVLGPP